MCMFRLVATFVSVFLAALAGNRVGDQLRALATGTPERELRLVHTNEQGEIVIAANPVLTNLIPAVLLGLILTPGWLWAFIGGVIASGIVGDRYEQRFLQRFSGSPVDDDVPSE